MNRKYIDHRYVRRIDIEGEELRAKEFEKKNGFPLSWVQPTYYGEMPGEYPKTYVEFKGNVAKVRHIERPPTNMPGRRTEITELSKKSRKRLLEFLASIRWQDFDPKSIYEVTLTYHENYPDDGQEVKRHLHNFRKELMTSYQDSIIIWKLEFQRRGAPHYHLILITKDPVELGNYMILKDHKLVFYDREKKKIIEEGSKGLRFFIQKSWNKFTHESEKHFNSGIEVEKVKSPTGLPYYMAKYMAKESVFDDYQHEVPEWFKNSGRWWGCYNKARLGIKKRLVLINPDIKELLTENIKKYWSDKGMPEYKTHDYGINMYALDKLDIQRYIWDIILDNPEKTFN